MEHANRRPKAWISSDVGGSFRARLWGALTLRQASYREIASFPDAMGDASLVVLGTAAAVALGAGARVALALLGGWLASAGFVWLVGAVGSSARGLGASFSALAFANVPQILLLFANLPIAGIAFAWMALVWGWLAYVVATREVVSCATSRAVVIGSATYGIRLFFAQTLVAGASTLASLSS